MLDSAIPKAAALIEALSYIQRFHDKTIVVKVGGSIMDDETALSNILTDIVFMNYVNMQPILVHGGGKAINQKMEQAGLVPQMVQGRRYTDDRVLAIAEQVLCNDINRFIVTFIQSQGCEAMGLHPLSSNVLFGEKIYLQGEGGRRIDLGHVGDVKSVNARMLQLLVQADSIPCIASIATDQAGGRLNVNRIEEMVHNGTISSGMLPKVEACVHALRAGVSKTHIIDGKIPHSLLLEIYTEAGIGTEIVL